MAERQTLDSSEESKKLESVIKQELDAEPLLVLVFVVRYGAHFILYASTCYRSGYFTFD